MSAQLLPGIRSRYGDIQAEQEDWGWFIWFARGETALAVDIFCDEEESGYYRLHLTSRIKRRFLSDVVKDTAELEDLRTLVNDTITEWLGRAPTVTRLDSKYLPRNGAG